MGSFERKFGDALIRLAGQVRLRCICCGIVAKCTQDPYIGTVFGTQIQFMRPPLDLLHVSPFDICNRVILNLSQPYVLCRALWSMWTYRD